jgi:cytochrome c-type biogenesis protein CcmF
LRKAFYWPAICSAAACIALLASGMRSFCAVVCLTLCAFVLAAIVEEFYKGTRIRAKGRGEGYLAAAVKLTLRNKRRYGGYVVHLAIAVIFVGLTGNAFNREASQQLAAGQEMKIGDFSLKMAGFEEGQTPNYQYGRLILQAFEDGKLVQTLKPEKRVFFAGEQQSTTTVALHSTPKEDLYVVFAGISDDGSKYEVKAHVNPLVFWVWFGSAIMVFGAVITLLPERLAGR